MSRVYLSGPMRGLPELNFPAFHRGAAFLRARGHIVFNPAELKGNGDDDLRELMAKEQAWICIEADAIALLPGWKESKGACAEFMLARALGLKIIALQLNCDHGFADPASCPTCQHFEAVRAAE